MIKRYRPHSPTQTAEQIKEYALAIIQTCFWLTLTVAINAVAFRIIVYFLMYARHIIQNSN